MAFPAPIPVLDKESWISLIPSENMIPRVSSMDQFFFDHFIPKTPCIISAKEVPWNYGQFSPEQLQQSFTDYVHSFRYTVDGNKKTTIEIPLQEYISKLFHETDITKCPENLPIVHSTSEKIPYARHIGPLTGHLHDQIPVDLLFTAEQKNKLIFEKFLFIGAAGTKTNNHFDLSDNFAFVAHGIKHVTLMPPGSESQMSNLDEDFRSKLGRGDCFFMDDGLDFNLVPRVDSTGALVSGAYMMHNHLVLHSCDKLLYSPLFPGDIIFFPARWYHYFHNITSTISVSVQTHSLHDHPSMDDDL